MNTCFNQESVFRIAGLPAIPSVDYALWRKASISYLGASLCASNAFLGKTFESMERIQNTFPKIHKIPAFPELINANIQCLSLPMGRMGEICALFEKISWSPVITRFNELPERAQNTVILLGEHGWFFDLEMPLSWIWEMGENLSDGKEKEVEETLVAYFEERTDEIERTLSERFSSRASILKAAFNAHRREEYELSIPVLLAQADGICKELFDQYFFTKKDKKPCTAKYVEALEKDTFQRALMGPLAQTLPINASRNEREEDKNVFNRHTVMHGDSLDYGNKINSLKTISLINYVAHVLEERNENRDLGDTIESNEQKEAG